MFIHRNRLLSATVAISVLLSAAAAAPVGRALSETGGETMDAYVPFYNTCYSDSDCTATVRSRYPSQSLAGVQLCKCYAASSITPFDECEGESDTTCVAARCADSCIRQVAYCMSSSSTCFLRKADEIETE